MARIRQLLCLGLLAGCSPDRAEHARDNALNEQSRSVATIDPSEWIWLISENESGLRLMHALPESDVGDYIFMCDQSGLHLWYSLFADESVPYGTVRTTIIKLKIGGTERSLPARAKFEDYGSPDMDAKIDDAGSVLRDMLSAKTIETKDEWAELSAPAPADGIVRSFAKRCAIAI